MFCFLFHISELPISLEEGLCFLEKQLPPFVKVSMLTSSTKWWSDGVSIERIIVFLFLYLNGLSEDCKDTRDLFWVE